MSIPLPPPRQKKERERERESVCVGVLDANGNVHDPHEMPDAMAVERRIGFIKILISAAQSRDGGFGGRGDHLDETSPTPRHIGL